MTQTAWLGFSIDRNSGTPVFEQICAAIRDGAITGALEAGRKLPATRVFATEIGVSRSTVVTAYEQLVAEGYLEAVRGSGYRICAMGEVELSRKVDPVRPEADLAPRGFPLPFEAGHPDMQLFPHRQWAKAVARVCRVAPQSMLVGGSHLGNPDLRKAIAGHVAEWRGIDASPNQVIVTAGSTDGLEVCLRTLIGAGGTVALENPGYMPLRRFVEAQGMQATYMGIDGSGAEVPGDDSGARLAILTPSHQYPLGGAMSPNRRMEFIRWAERGDAWLIEDDYDSEFRYAGRPIPALAGFDHLNRTIYVGSFSKIFSNTLRLGYLVLPESLVTPVADTIRRFGAKASFMPQQALAEFIDKGEFYRHLRRMRRVYAERRKFLLARLAGWQEFGACVDHQAGMQLVFHLREGISDRDVEALAEEKGVIARALSRYAVGGQGYNGLMLGFCAYGEDDMAAALDVLEGCLREVAAG